VINIPDQNFGVNPKISETGVGVLYTNVVATTDGVTATAQVAPDAPFGQVSITLTSRGASGNGFVGPESPTVTASGVVQPLPAVASFAVLRLAYPSATPGGDSTGNCATNQQLTSAAGVTIVGNVVSYPVVVGQQINLTGCIPVNGGIAVHSATWVADPLFTSTVVNGATTGGNAIGGFSVVMDDVYRFHEVITPVPAAPSCLTTQSCDFPTFYFLTQGTYTFTFQYQLESGSLSPLETINFTVYGPTPGTDDHYLNFPPTQSTVGMEASSDLGLHLSSSGNNSILPGINISVEGGPNGVTLPQGIPGGWQSVQLVSAVSLQIREPQGTENYLIQTSLALDTLYPYLALRPNSANDTPRTQTLGTELWTHAVTIQGEETEDFEARMHLLWDPSLPPDGAPGCVKAVANLSVTTQIPTYSASDCSFIPVPLEYIDWGWYGDTINTLNINSYSTGWYMSDGSTYAPDRGSSIGVYPVWAVTCGVAVKCPSLLP
jgi:hypothetical protein